MEKSNHRRRKIFRTCFVGIECAEIWMLVRCTKREREERERECVREKKKCIGKNRPRLKLSSSPEPSEMQTWEDEKTHLKKFQSAKKMIPNFDPRNQIDRPKKWESGKNNLQKISKAAI